MRSSIPLALMLVMGLAARGYGFDADSPVVDPEKPSVKARPEDPVHNELRELKRELTEAVNKNDINAVMARLDKDVVITWENGTVSRGPDQVKEFLEKMTKGDKPVFKTFKTEPEVKELTLLYADKTVGVAFGHSKDQRVLADGTELSTTTHWSATLVKKDGKWLIASFHGSGNVFDNPVLNMAVKRTATWVGIGAGAGGLLLGAGLMWFIKRRKA